MRKIFDKLKQKYQDYEKSIVEKKEPVKIKCLYCGHKFVPIKEPSAAHVGKGLIFLPWGIVSALKSRIVYPRCKMKIGQ